MRVAGPSTSIGMSVPPLWPGSRPHPCRSCQKISSPRGWPSYWPAIATLTAVAGMLAGLLPAADGAPFAGSYLTYTENWEQCDPNEYDHKGEMFFKTSRFNFRRPYESQTLTGNTTLLTAWDDTLWIRLRLDSWSNGEWKKNAFNFNFPISGCTNGRLHVPDFYRIVYKKDPYSTEPCYIKPGTYSVSEAPINWTFPKFPIMAYGHWHFQFNFGRGRSTHGCINGEVYTIPKPRAHRRA